MFKYELNVWELILEVINRLYPSFDAKISFLETSQFQKELQSRIDDGAITPEGANEACGFTCFDGASAPVIMIDAAIPCDCSIDAIAHEAAHVIAGVKEDHGEKWEQIFDKIQKEYSEIIGKLGEVRQDWVIEIQREYYHSSKSGGMEPDFYKARLYANMTASEMEEIIDGDEFGRCMRRAVPYKEAEKEYLERQAQNLERQKKWDMLEKLAKKSPKEKIIIKVTNPVDCTLSVETSYVIKVLERLQAIDFCIVESEAVLVEKPKMDSKSMALALIKQLKRFTHEGLLLELRRGGYSGWLEPDMPLEEFLDDYVTKGALKYHTTSKEYELVYP